MLKSSSVQRIINHSICAKFKVVPRPHNLKQSLAVYEHLAQVASKHNGGVISYYQRICPVTKERLEQLRVIFHDPNRPTEIENVLKDVFADGKVLEPFEDSKGSALSQLEQELIYEKHSDIEADGARMTVQLEALSREPSQIRASRDHKMIRLVNSIETGTNGRIDVDKSIAVADQKYLKEMKEFLDIFK